MKFRNPGVTKETLLAMCESSFDAEIAKHFTVSPESNNSRKQGGLSFYCMKIDSCVEGPWSDKPVEEKYNGEDLACLQTPHPWQKFVLDKIEEYPDDRTIHWIYDKKGCHGKSKLCKFLKWKSIAKRIPMGSATQLKTNVIKKGKSRVYLIDMPRKRGHDERMEDVILLVTVGNYTELSEQKFTRYQFYWMKIQVWSVSTPPKTVHGYMSVKLVVPRSEHS
eukprot:gene268-489_t